MIVVVLTTMLAPTSWLLLTKVTGGMLLNVTQDPVTFPRYYDFGPTGVRIQNVSWKASLLLTFSSGGSSEKAALPAA